MANRVMDHRGCHFLPRHAAAERIEGIDIAELVTEFEPGAREVSAAELLEYPDERAVARIDDSTSIIETEPDSLDELIVFLNDGDVPTSRIYAVGFGSHWCFAPGTDPQQVPRFDLPDVDSGNEDLVVAVVDSGFNPHGNLPEWLKKPNVIFDPEDEETGSSSHGTFVAGLIRQLSPEHRVSLAAARLVGTHKFNQENSEPGHDNARPPAITSEVEVAQAICRLIDRADDLGHRPAALNLSLGAYTCETDDEVVVLRKALQAWRTAFGHKSLIFAAGGNAETNARFYPAALPGVKAVAAGKDGSDKVVVWDDSRNPVDIAAAERNWIDNSAPGLDLINHDGPGLPVSWSGSSFATAVATALTVRGEGPTVGSDGDWWLDKPIDYRNISGLSYVGPVGPVTNP